MAVSTDIGDARTVVERVCEDRSLAHNISTVPDEVAEQVVRGRREDMFELFWNKLVLEKDEVLQTVRVAEASFVQEYEDVSDEIPEWVLRAEAQDRMKRIFLQKIRDCTQS